MVAPPLHVVLFLMVARPPVHTSRPSTQHLRAPRALKAAERFVPQKRMNNTIALLAIAFAVVCAHNGVRVSYTYTGPRGEVYDGGEGFARITGGSQGGGSYYGSQRGLGFARITGGSQGRGNYYGSQRGLGFATITGGSQGWGGYYGSQKGPGFETIVGGSRGSRGRGHLALLPPYLININVTAINEYFTIMANTSMTIGDKENKLYEWGAKNGVSREVEELIANITEYEEEIKENVYRVLKFVSNQFPRNPHGRLWGLCKLMGIGGTGWPRGPRGPRGHGRKRNWSQGPNSSIERDRFYPYFQI
ncbi:unnamed protein product [Strongylus vulgaris]|uniref:SXP/RAL-2 family protein Ani s 5-like cation-binding domain-containing protein n=1 Tax=Strongylus vulgaris TaxID=40348 RepID=A0A3P7K9H1_STRVU|nr:unnamed protein product [Strongylus vulgaris]